MNLLQQIFDSPYTAKLGLVLLHSLWQIALIAIVVKLALDALGENGNRTSKLRYSIAYMGLVAICFLPVLTWAVVEAPEPLPLALAQATSSLLEPAPKIPESSSLFLELADQLPQSPETNVATLPTDLTASQTERPVKHSSLGAWIVCGWLLGMVLFAIRPLVGFRSASRLKTTGHQKVPGWVAQTIERLKDKIGLRKSVAIAQSALVAVPTVVGLIRPTILLPLSCLTNLTADELDSILLHELAHIRRHDQLANLIQVLIETVFFFHPLVWWISRVVRNERENCCDDMAVEACGNSKSLVNALLSLEQSRGEKYRNLAGVMASDGGSLVTRVKRLVEPELRHRSPAQGMVVSMAVAIAATCILASSVLFANSEPSNDSSESAFDIVAMHINKSLNDRYAVVEIESLNDDLYEWDSLRTNDSRMVHRLWNITTPELRNQTGRQIEGWKPDLLLHFVEASDGTSPERVTIQVKLSDGFQWSIGNGVWDMPFQLPLTYTLSEIKSRPSDDQKGLHPDRPEIQHKYKSRERLFNTTTYEQAKNSIRENHKSGWVAIVDGRILASYDSFEKCVEAADEANRHASHRFIFRAGIDDIDAEFTYSPWKTGDPNWWQLGRQFRNDHKIAISVDRWMANATLGEPGVNSGRTPAKSADYNNATIELRAPGNNTAVVTRPVIASGMVQQQLTITEQDSTELHLSRFSIPGSAHCKMYDSKVRRVFVSTSIPDLKIAQRVSAFVAPNEIVQLDPPKAGTSRDDALFPSISLPSNADGKDDAAKLHSASGITGSVKIKVLADAGTIVLTGDPKDVAKVQELIKQLKQQSEADSKKNGDGPVNSLEQPTSSVSMSLDGEPIEITLIGERDSIKRIEKLINEFVDQANPKTTPSIEMLTFQDAEFADAVEKIKRLEKAGDQTKHGLVGEFKYSIDASNKSIAVVSTPQNLEQIRKLLMDVEQPVYESLSMRTASATSIADRLRAVLMESQLKGPRLTGPVKVIEDARTNRIVLVGSESDVAKAREIAEKLSREANSKGGGKHSDRDNIQGEASTPTVGTQASEDAEALVERVKSMLKSDPQKYGMKGPVDIRLDETTGAIILIGSESDADKVRNLIKELSSEPRSMDVGKDVARDNVQAETVPALSIVSADEHAQALVEQVNSILEEDCEKIGLDGPVKIRVLEEMQTITLVGAKSDVAKVQKIIEELKRKAPQTDDSNDSAAKEPSQPTLEAYKIEQDHFADSISALNELAQPEKLKALGFSAELSFMSKEGSHEIIVSSTPNGHAFIRKLLAEVANRKKSTNGPVDSNATPSDSQTGLESKGNFKIENRKEGLVVTVGESPEGVEAVEKTMLRIMQDSPEEAKKILQTWAGIDNELNSLQVRIAKLKENLGPNHPDTVAAINQTKVLWRQKELAVEQRLQRMVRNSELLDEIRFQEKALTSLEAQFGKEHPSVKTIESAIIELQKQRSNLNTDGVAKPKTAEEQTATLAIFEATAKLEEARSKFSDDHPTVAAWLKKELDLAKQLYSEQLKRSPEVTLSRQAQLLKLQRQQAKDVAATKLIELKIQLVDARTKYGTDHPTIAMLENQIERFHWYFPELKSSDLEDKPAPKDSGNTVANQQRVLELKMQKSQLEEKYGSSHPDVRSLQQQIELWEQFEKQEDLFDVEFKKRWENSVDSPKKDRLR